MVAFLTTTTALVALTAYIVSSEAASVSLERQQNDAAQYWWMYPNSDCGYDDVQPTCTGDTVDQCKAKCLATPGCGGFNYPHGIMKKTSCLSKKAPSTVDLYVLEDTPQPPPPPTPPPPPPQPKIWPLPKNYTKGTQVLTVSSTFTFSDASSPQSPTLAKAFERYKSLTFPHAVTPTGSLSQLQVTVAHVDESHPQMETDESYTLNVPTSGQASIVANTIYGAMHGLETFSQLVRYNFTSSNYEIADAPWTINDSPRFPHRGLMVDTARHFETLASLRKMIDSLPYSKLNVLHWHMSDDQSFPMQSKSNPSLWMGAHSEVEKYTQADIATIVEYARERGVRVIVEFDMPGHASSWCAGHPEVCPSTSCKSPLNVANNATFNLITQLLDEMTGGKSSTPGNPMGLFPTNLIHLGGDEVNTGCWTKVPAVAAWLSAHNMTGDDAYAYFVKTVADIAIAQGRRPIQWVEVFDHFGTKLDKRTIVHVWKSKDTVAQVVADGYNALYNPSSGGDAWYLDHLTVPWDMAYMNDPCGAVATADQCKLVLGGQGEMWGETVDASDIQNTVWPRMAAIGERLWSPKETTTSTVTATPRIESFRCLLNRRGIAAAPVKNGEARSSPPGPGSCLDQ